MRKDTLNTIGLIVSVVGLGLTVKSMIDAKKTEEMARLRQKEFEEALKFAIVMNAAQSRGLTSSGASALELDLDDFIERPTFLESIT